MKCAASPANCVGCRVGPLTSYAPLWRSEPKRVCAKRTEVLHFRAHQLIQKAGEASEFAYTLYQGWACRAVQFPDGRRQILSFLLPGDTVLLEAVCDHSYVLPFSVRALTDVSLCAFKADALRTLMQHESGRLERETLSQMAYAERRLADIGRRRAVGSLAHLVLDIEATLRARKLVDGDTFFFPLRQEDLADALGLTPAHVNRTLVMLRQMGVLQIRQNELHLLDKKRLRVIAASN